MAYAVRISIALVVALCTVRCGDVTDPAVRAATCLEEAASSHSPGAASPFDWPCDLQLKGQALLLLHPAGELPDAALVAAGVPSAIVPAIRSLRLGPQEAIFVVSLGRTEPSSRTTYQARFVSIRSPIATTLSSSRITFSLRPTTVPSANGTSLEVVGVR